MPARPAGICAHWTAGLATLAPAITSQEEKPVAKGQKRSNKEVRKPKAEKPKKNASNPSTTGMISNAKH